MHAMPWHAMVIGRGGGARVILSGIGDCTVVMFGVDLIYFFFAGTERIVGYIVPKGNLTYGRVPYLWVRKVLR